MTYENNHAICILASHTERFIQERRYLKGVSQATEAWYRYSLKAFAPVLDEPHQSTTALKGAVMAQIGTLMQAANGSRGNRAVSVNTYLRCLKAFLRWANEEGILPEPIRLAWLKEPEKILPTLSAEQIKRIVDWKPPTAAFRRLHTMALTALDTGLRIGELLSLQRPDIDFDNLLLRVTGKGNKQRLVPISLELRKRLYRATASGDGGLVFATRNGTWLSQRDVLRDFKKMCKRLNIVDVRCSFHTLRHTFAVTYLRGGGNLYFLQRILGHSAITTTERYLRSLGVQDLQAVHDRLSPLAPKHLRGGRGQM